MDLTAALIKTRSLPVDCCGGHKLASYVPSCSIYSQPPVHNASMITLDPGPTGEQTTDYVPIFGMRAGTMIPAGPPPGMRVINLLHYRRIGHSLAAVVFGLVGAMLGALFSARSKASDEQEGLRKSIPPGPTDPASTNPSRSC
jgi:hypothetical protein